MKALSETNYQFDGLEGIYRGKVRDIYRVKGKFISISTDRLSAFDHILHNPIPFKGQVLNQMAAYFLQQTSNIVPNWLEAVPDPNVSIGKVCKPIKIEMVIRGYLAGHAWRLYKGGARSICGERMPDGLSESDPFPEPIITPATKAENGHDEDITRDEIIEQGIVSESIYLQLEDYTRQLFAFGQNRALERGLILVDTKYEFGFFRGQVFLIDEVHTPDSSRYYYADGYEDRQRRGERQIQLSKEFVREWLMSQGFQGLQGQVQPVMPEEIIREVSKRYIELYERMTGKDFQPAPAENIHARIRDNVSNFLASR